MSGEVSLVPPTLEDVAAAAGVSPATVSRVLNGRVKVSADKAQAVRIAVEQLNYHPNPAARLLANKRQSMIAIIVHNTVRYGYSKTIEGIGLAASEAGYSVMITVVESGSDFHVDRAVELIMAQSISGVVLVDFDEVARKVLAKLPGTLRAVIAGGHQDDGGDVPRVYMDDTSAGYHAARYLLDLGHPTVHLMAIPATDQSNGRNIGWQRALEDAGVPVPDIIHCDYSSASGYLKAQQLFALPEVSAVLCGNDEVALGVMSYATDHGMSIPHDLSIVSFDDQPFAEIVRPALTTVRQDFVTLGGAAFDTLRRLIEGQSVPRFAAYDGQLIVRQSTAQK